MADEERELIRGTVRVARGRVPFGRVEIEAEGTHYAVAREEAFDLDTGGRTIGVRVASTTALLPERTLRGAFGDLVGDDLGKLALERAPGDHVETRLRGNAVIDGNVVTVYGTVERRPAGGSYREAPELEPHAIDAEAIALGDDGDELVERWRANRRQQQARAPAKHAKTKPAQRAKKPPPPRREPRLLAVWVFGAIAAGGAALAAVAPVRMIGLTLALATAAIAIFMWRTVRWMPEFVRVDESASGSGVRWNVLGWTSVATMLAIGAVMTAGLSAAAGLYITAATAVLLLFILVQRDRRSASTARALLRARPLASELPDGAFGALTGHFDGELCLSRKHDTTSESWTETRYDQRGHAFQAKATAAHFRWTDEWKVTSGTLENEHGKIALATAGASWAAVPDVVYAEKASFGVEHFIKHMEPDMAERIRRADVRSRPTLTMRHARGDAMLVAGRVHREDGKVKLRVTGAGSLLMFSAPRGSDARAHLRRELVRHYLGLALLAAIAIAAAGTATIAPPGSSTITTTSPR